MAQKHEYGFSWVYYNDENMRIGDGTFVTNGKMNERTLDQAREKLRNEKDFNFDGIPVILNVYEIGYTGEDE